MKSVRMKLIATFVAMISLLLIIVIISIFSTKSVTNEYDIILEENLDTVDLLDQIILSQSHIVSDLRAYLLYNNEADRQRLEQNIETVSDLADDFAVKVSKYETLQQPIAEMMTLGGDYAERVPSLIASGTDETERAIQEREEAAQINRDFVAQVGHVKEVLHDITDENLSELNQVVKRSTNVMLIVATVAIFGGLAIFIILSRSIRVPLEKATIALEEMADGNLAIEAVHVKTKDETARMAQSLNDMLGTWQSVVKRVNDTSTELAAQSQQLSASAEESLASSEMVATTAEQNMRNSEDQENYVQQATESLNEVSIGIDQITESNEDMLQSAEEMDRYVQTGKRVMDDVAIQMQDIDQTIQESTEIMEQMARKSSEIQEASSLIAGISEQTNLLALNAAIEAARAGEHGAGFAVVAEEVRNLAEESTRSASKIDEMIIEVREAAERAVRSINRGQEKVSEGLERTTESLDTFNQIERSVTDVNERIETVSAAVEQIQAMTNEVLRSTTTLRSLADESTASAQNTSAATEEQLAAMEQISASSEQLSKLAEELQDEISQFKLF
ncbi:methyl-accepting chemotaxis protein [Savagea faecisuis]|uniref:Methyl-accepting chemotaxis protein n=1 Tax=Savagea faecisuis TaxID=1274803 RepID=A0ABW3GW70_9BACL